MKVAVSAGLLVWLVSRVDSRGIGDALAGVLILALGVVLNGSTATLAVLVIILVAVWLIATLRLRLAYVTELGRHLGRMTLDWIHDPVPLDERTVLESVGTAETARARATDRK